MNLREASAKWGGWKQETRRNPWQLGKNIDVDSSNWIATLIDGPMECTAQKHCDVARHVYGLFEALPLLRPDESVVCQQATLMRRACA